MATRNPMNQRYNSDEKTGQTRKSAASLKPKRKAADTVYIKSSSKSKTAFGKTAPQLSKEERRIEREKARAEGNAIYSVATILMKEDPAYQKWRKIFWVLIALVALGVIGTFIAQILLKNSAPQIAFALLLIAYIPMILSLILDFWKIRPVRREARMKAASMSKKQIDAILEREVLKNQQKKGKTLSKKEEARIAAAETQPKVAEVHELADKVESSAAEAESASHEAPKRDMSRINSYRRGSRS